MLTVPVTKISCIPVDIPHLIAGELTHVRWNEATSRAASWEVISVYQLHMQFRVGCCVCNKQRRIAQQTDYRLPVIVIICSHIVSGRFDNVIQVIQLGPTRAPSLSVHLALYLLYPPALYTNYYRLS